MIIFLKRTSKFEEKNLAQLKSVIGENHNLIYMEEKIENGKVVDLTYVKDLSRGNTEFIKEIISIFLEENPGEINTIENAVAENNYAVIKSTAHKLKSTIPFIGLDKIVGTNVAEMEALAARSSNIEMIKDHLVKVKEVCERSYKELEPILKDL